ncbi:MAG: hypothetical protein V1853_02805 [bacterium]
MQKIKSANVYIWIAVVLFGLAFILVYSLGFRGADQKYGSPDETANAFFAKQFADQGSFRLEEPLLPVSNGLLHPRSMKVVEGAVVPGSWLGLPLMYGFLIKFFSAAALPYLTLVFSFFAGLAFFAWLKSLFNRKIAFVSVLLFFIHPIFWFYNSRPLWNNTLFVDLFIISLAAFHFWLKNKKWYWAALTGLALGLTLIVRTSEAVWVILALVIYWAVQKISLPWKQILIAFGVVIIVFLPLAYYQRDTYGSLLSTGYTIADNYYSPMNDNQSDQTGFISQAARAIFPFGIKLEALRVFSDYQLKYFAGWTIFGLIGLMALLMSSLRKHYSSLLGFSLMVLFINVWLVLMYGSFQFNEFADRSALLFGSSYLRYWLPGLILQIPLMVIAVEKIAQLVKGRWIKAVVFSLLIISLVAFSVSKVVYEPLYGLSLNRSEAVSAEQENEKLVAAFVESRSVLLVKDKDKVYFPKYRVIGYNDFTAELQAASNSLETQVPIYLLSRGQLEVDLANRLAGQTNKQWQLALPLLDSYGLYLLKTL